MHVPGNALVSLIPEKDVSRDAFRVSRLEPDDRFSAAACLGWLHSGVTRQQASAAAVRANFTP